MRTYIIKPIESNKFNYEQFITDIAYNANIALSKQIRIRRGIRAQFTLLANFYLSADKEKKLSEKNFNTACNVLVNSSDVKEQIEIFQDNLIDEISEFQNNQSGWVFHSIIFLENKYL